MNFSYYSLPTSAGKPSGGGGEITFKSGKEKVTVTVSDPWSYLKGQGVKDPKKKKKDQVVFGSSLPLNSAFTRHVEGKDCNATLYLHLWIDPQAAKDGGCDLEEDVQAAVEDFEDAVERYWTDLACPCEEEGEKNKGCKFSVKLVWEEKDRGSKNVTVNLWCEDSEEDEKKKKKRKKRKKRKKPKTNGRYDKRKNSMDLRDDADDYTIAHEIGHALFGIPGPRSLKDYYTKERDGHFKFKNEDGTTRDPLNLMTGGASVPSNTELSQEEICALIDLHKLCKPKVCCPKGKKLKPIPPPPRRRRTKSLWIPRSALS